MRARIGPSASMTTPSSSSSESSRRDARLRSRAASTTSRYGGAGASAPPPAPPAPRTRRLAAGTGGSRRRAGGRNCRDGGDPMAFNPLEQRGMPVEDQFRSWSELSVEPLDKLGDPYTRCRAILMNGVEVASILFAHQFARATDDLDIRRTLALGRRIDQ